MRYDFSGEPIMTDKQLRDCFEALVDLASSTTTIPSEILYNGYAIDQITEDIFNA